MQYREAILLEVKRAKMYNVNKLSKETYEDLNKIM